MRQIRRQCVSGQPKENKPVKDIRGPECILADIATNTSSQRIVTSLLMKAKCGDELHGKADQVP